MNLKSYLTIYLKGIAMGASYVVPGVSGGTIAFITGIYERLINAIKSFNLTSLKLLFTGKFKAFWQAVDASFLLALILGIATSFISLAKVITFLLIAYPTFVWSFFFGLILASAFYVGREVKWNYKTIIATIAFAIISFNITSPSNAPMVTDSSLWYIFLCGAIAICAMILPGISGSFILVLLGQYFYILESLVQLNFLVIIVFIAGAVVGLLLFSNILSWLFKHFKMVTLASLTGFLLGSLNKIWPWKQTLETMLDRHGVEQPIIQANVLPEINSQFFICIGLILFGLLLILGIETIANRSRKTKKEVA